MTFVRELAINIHCVMEETLKTFGCELVINNI